MDNPDSRLSAETPSPPPNLAGGMNLTAWRKAVGISRTAAWSYRKTGRINVVWRYGRAYLTAQAIKKFSDEFATEPGRSINLKSKRASTG